ncbi:MAG: hypothetical protein Q7R41_15975 [Phycisphaerales bacterium]|nr:hypothetical protein [Phycisphaerales bacterium]
MSAAFFVAIAISTASVGPTSSLNYVRTMTDGISYPARIAPTPGGGVYVTDPPMKLIAEYSAAGALVGTHSIPEGAVGIAVHGDGRIFIARDNGTIGVYSTAFAFLYTVNPTPLTLTGPNDLAFNPATNELYTVDSGSHRVLVFVESAPGSGTWGLTRSWGMEGTGLGQFAAPQAIALNPTLGHVIVTDADNFRIQVFNTSGILLFKFGYRTLYLPTSELAWFARSEGVAVDSCGNVYISDALMGTVRVFSITPAAPHCEGGTNPWAACTSNSDCLGGGTCVMATAKELGTTHTPVVSYGTGAGHVRVPCDITIDSADRLFVADTNNGAVQVFDITCGAMASAGTPNDESRISRKPATGDRRSADGRTIIAPIAVVQPQMPDNPLEIVSAMNSGEYCAELDLNRDDAIDLADLQIAVSAFGAGTVEDFLNMANGVASASHPGLSPPHIIDLPNRCGRCHSMDGAPGGMLTALGQENLCQSCHSAGKIAGHDWIGPGDTEMNHPWGVLASDADPGPAPDSDVALHLDAGKVRCGACHDPHESSQGTCDTPSPLPGWEFPGHIGSCTGGSANGEPCQSDAQCEMTYMRTEGKKINLCGECHVQYEEWRHIGHGEELADPWSHYDWSMGNNWLCTGPGTPYAYCTGEGVGTAASAAAAACTGAGTPLACCTGPGLGSTCTVANASCLGAGSPWPCCTGTGTGTCANNLSAAACTGAGTPMACCTGVGTGSCSSREACRQCHSGNGFIDFSNDFPDGTVSTATHRGTFRIIDCLVCHTTHGTSQDESLLRIYDYVMLPTGQTVPLPGFPPAGPGATCMACHNGRTGPPVQNTTSSLSTPHYLLGGVMLEGINGVTFGYTLQNSNHTTNAGINCTTCHMAPGPISGPEVGKVGGHSFRLVDHDVEPPYENVANACGGCHTGLTTINRPAGGDYDGDLATEGVQDEVSGLLALVVAQLQAKGAVQLPGHPYWDIASVAVADRILVKNAIWNWEYVDNSGDLGVKNTGYAVGLLQVSYIKLAEPTPPPAWSPRYTAP